MKKGKMLFNKVFPCILSCSLIMGSVLPVSADASTEINGNIKSASIDISASSTANYIINGKTITSDTIGILNNSNFPISIGVANVEKTIGNLEDVLPESVGTQEQWFNLGKKDSESKIALGLKHTGGDYLDEFTSDTLYFKNVQDATDSIGLGALASKGNVEYQIDGFYGLAFSSDISEQYKITWEIGLYGNDDSSSSGESGSGDVATYSVDREVDTPLEYELTETSTQTASIADTLTDFFGVHTVKADPIDVPQDEVTNIVGEATITGLKDNSATEVYIADYYQDENGDYYKITGIAEGSSSSGTIVGDNLETVVISGITEVPAYAFYGNNNLANVTIGEDVVSIGKLAFASCKSLEYISIPDSVSTLGEKIFSGSYNLKKVTLPSNLTTISNGLFYNCSGLTDITIPSTVTTIEGGAFYGCSSLQVLVIPSSVTSIGQTVFQKCSGLTKIEIPSSVDSISSGLFMDCTGLTEIVLPENIDSIGMQAFSGCSSLETINLPSDLTTIDGSLFANCTALEEISIPDSVTIINASAFSGCTSLKTVSIPSNVSSIGNMCFQGCTGLESIIIPDSVTSLGMSAFKNCTNLSDCHASNYSSHLLQLYCRLNPTSPLYHLS